MFFARLCDFFGSQVRFVFTNRTQIMRNLSLFGYIYCSCVHVQPFGTLVDLSLYQVKLFGSTFPLLQTKVSHVQRRISSYHLDSQSTRLTYLDIIPSLGMLLLTIIAHSGMSIENQSLGHLEQPSIWVLSRHKLSCVHTKSFIDFVQNSKCIYQPPTHGWGRNVENVEQLKWGHQDICFLSRRE